MAQRMESVAPPGAVMLSESTARLVEGAATLGEVERVLIKGTDQPVLRPAGYWACWKDVTLSDVLSRIVVGRRWEIAAIESLLDRAVDAPRRSGGRGGPTWHR